MARPVGRVSRNTSLVVAASANALIGGDGCWPWLGEINGGGYGLTYMRGRAIRAHRAMYEVVVGPIPEGLDLDHLCRNRACVRPSHLEPVTNWENTRRGVGPFAQKAGQATCPKGHPYDSLRTRMGRPQVRRCSICDRGSRQRSRPREHAKRRAKRAAARAARESQQEDA